VLAAHRAGIKTVIMPKGNEKDLYDIPENVKKEIDFHFVDKMVDVIAVAFETE
jgi:ATP-dependent Lon protease